jgi:hypothetical protein
MTGGKTTSMWEPKDAPGLSARLGRLDRLGQPDGMVVPAEFDVPAQRPMGAFIVACTVQGLRRSQQFARA